MHSPHCSILDQWYWFVMKSWQFVHDAVSMTWGVAGMAWLTVWHKGWVSQRYSFLDHLLVSLFNTTKVIPWWHNWFQHYVNNLVYKNNLLYLLAYFFCPSAGFKGCQSWPLKCCMVNIYILFISDLTLECMDQSKVRHTDTFAFSMWKMM